MPRPTLTAEAVRAWAGAKFYDRGKELAEGGAVGGGGTYEAAGGVRVCGRVAGTYAPFYRVAATVTGQATDGAVAAGACTCPVGSGESPHGDNGRGRCKHVAALLLAYRAHPDAFPPGENPRAVLMRRSKAELAGLALNLLNRTAGADDEAAWNPETWDEDDHGLLPDPDPPAA